MQPLSRSFNGYESNPIRNENPKQRNHAVKKESCLQKKIKEVFSAFQINLDLSLVSKICHEALGINGNINPDLFHDDEQFFLFKTANKIYVLLKERRYWLASGSAKDVFSGFEYWSLAPIVYSLAPSNPNECKILTALKSKKIKWRDCPPTTNGVVQLLEQAIIPHQRADWSLKKFMGLRLDRPGALSELIKNPCAHLSYYDLAGKPTYKEKPERDDFFLSDKDYRELKTTKKMIHTCIDCIESMKSKGVELLQNPAFTIFQVGHHSYIFFTNQKYDKNSEGQIEMFQGLEYPSFKRIAVLTYQKQTKYEEALAFLQRSPLNKIEFTPFQSKDILERKQGTPSQELLIFPLANRGSLSQFLKQHTNLSYRHKLHIAQGIVKGLTTIHNEGIVHRDIKPENIFIHFIRKQNLLISEVGDLGLATYQKAYGTPLYFAPEKIASETPADIWALGATLYPLFFGSPPPWFEKMGEASKNSRLLIDWVEHLFPEPKNKNPIKHLIWRSVRPDWSQRPLLSEFEKKIEEEIYKIATLPKNRSATIGREKMTMIESEPRHEDRGS